MASEQDQIHELERRFVDLLRKIPRSPSETQEMERRSDAFVNALQKQAEPLFDELAEVGIRIKSVWDLVNTSASYPRAIPILVKHLNRPYHRRNKEGIVRALAVKEAKGNANKAIMEEYRRLPKENPEEPWIYHFRWAFGNTMRVIVTKDDLDELVDIVLDEANGDSRNSFVEALAKLKSPKVVDALNRLVNDKSQPVADTAKKMLKKKTRSS